MNRKRIIGLVIVLILVALPTWSALSGLQRMRTNVLLVQAAKKGDLARATSLLSQGADPNCRDYDEHPSEEVQNQPMYSAGMQSGMIPWAGDRHKTVLQCALAREHENVELVRLLLQHGAKIQTTDEAGTTPLMLAAWFNAVESMKLLIGNGADVNVTDKNGYTPLMMAASNGSVEATKLLLSRGADPKVKDSLGQTAQDKADMLGKTQVAQVLRASGANGTGKP
ncbi:MAG TPA: ankyrin repeat domain-containing protein [Chthonomonadaceae bacterium]|nr:ankyrin repeat domain-containing protein [Chthonomonadaceae bacterium]